MPDLKGVEVKPPTPVRVLYRRYTMPEVLGWASHRHYTDSCLVFVVLDNEIAGYIDELFLEEVK